MMRRQMPDHAPQLDYAAAESSPARLAMFGGLTSLALSALCLIARLTREAGWLDAADPIRRLAGNPITSASLGFALLAGVLASVARVTADRWPERDHRAAAIRRAFPLVLGLAVALATLGGFILV